MTTIAYLKLQILLLCLGRLALSIGINDTHFWGAYRPNLYFGLKPRIPQSLMTGLMWFSTQDYQSISRTRHACDQSDKLDSYTWTTYDARQGGVQVIRDSENNVEITTEFLKVVGGTRGGNWAARIKGKPVKLDAPARISTIFYFGLEGLGGLEMETEEDEDGINGEFKISGSTPELDDFVIRIIDGSDNKPVTEGAHAVKFKNRIGKTHFLGLSIPSGNIWKAKDFILKALMERAREVITPYQDHTIGLPDPSYVLQLPDEVYTGSNLFAIQKLFEGPFQFDVFFESTSSNQKLSSEIIEQGIAALVEAHDERFQSVFPYPPDYPQEQREQLTAFSKAVTSNLIAGVGYFYGSSLTDRNFSHEWDKDEDIVISTSHGHDSMGPMLTEPKELLTATPSRSFFPRGFYWDEGFHLLHIGQWDIDFGLEILKDWVNLIDEEGWVAREQILGDEARSKVPQEFHVQVPNYANPPTLAMAVTSFILRLKSAATSREPSTEDLGLQLNAAMGGISQALMQGPLSISKSSSDSQYMESPELALSFLKSIYKPLKRHYDWFRRTQRGNIKQYSRKARSMTEGYRWRGRTELHVLTSGMDDYPRGPPHVGELHLDLISWMAFFTRTMKEIAGHVGETDDEISFGEIEKAILRNIDDLHWNEEERMYCDLGVNGEEESYHICHKGYLSLFPLFLSLLPPTSPQLGHILDILQDPNHLWSPYGIRSLSISHPEFGQSENYWKGPIWVQINYLILSALHQTYMVKPGPYQERSKDIYSKLRKNIVENIHQEYERTGYVWEQYDAISGKGKRSHPFTGWTSLVTLILAETY